MSPSSLPKVLHWSKIDKGYILERSVIRIHFSLWDNCKMFVCKCRSSAQFVCSQLLQNIKPLWRRWSDDLQNIDKEILPRNLCIELVSCVLATHLGKYRRYSFSFSHTGNTAFKDIFISNLFHTNPKYLYRQMFTAQALKKMFPKVLSCNEYFQLFSPLVSTLVAPQMSWWCKWMISCTSNLSWLQLKLKPLR